MKIDFTPVANTLTAALIGWSVFQIVENKSDILINKFEIQQLKEQK